MARASIKKTSVDRTISNKKDIKMSFAMGRRIKSGVSASSTLGSGQGSGGSIDVKGHYLETAGGTMIGPIAFYPQAVAVLSDSIDISSTAGNYSTYVIANGQGGVADNLSKIIGAAFSGQELIIQAAATTPITLKDIATPGNIHLPGGVDVLIPALDAVTLIFDPTQASGGRWILSAGSGSGGSALGDKIFEGNSSVEVIDTGAIGSIIFTVDGISQANLTEAFGWNLDNDIRLNGNFIYLDADNNSRFNLVTDDTLILELGTTPKIYAFTTLGLDVGDMDILGVKNIDMDDSNSTIHGVKKIEFYDSFPDIYMTSGATGIGLLVPSNKSIQFFGNGFLIAKFEDVAGVIGLDMNANKIVNTREHLFSTSEDAIISNTQAGMGFHNTLNKMFFNIPTGNIYSFEINSSLQFAITSGAQGGQLSGIGDVNTRQLTLNVNATPPSINGVIASDGTDIRVFSGNALRNLSNIGPDFSDELFIIHDDITPTKKLRFSLALASGTSLITTNTLTAARTWILPDVSSTFAMLGATQTFTGSNTFTGNVTFGDSSGDLISFIGRFNTDLLPSTNAVRDLGSASLTLDEIHGQKLFAYNRMKIPVGTNMYS